MLLPQKTTGQQRSIRCSIVFSMINIAQAGLMPCFSNIGQIVDRGKPLLGRAADAGSLWLARSHGQQQERASYRNPMYGVFTVPPPNSSKYRCRYRYRYFCEFNSKYRYRYRYRYITPNSQGALGQRQKNNQPRAPGREAALSGRPRLAHAQQGPDPVSAAQRRMCLCLKPHAAAWQHQQKHACVACKHVQAAGLAVAARRVPSVLGRGLMHPQTCTQGQIPALQPRQECS